MRWPIVVQGREVDEQNVRWLSGWIGQHAHWSRRKLAGELCLRWDWRDGRGRPKDPAARGFPLTRQQQASFTLMTVSGTVTLAAIRGYFQIHRDHRDHLDDAGMAARGAPIGSGPMESVRSRFQDRLKRRGRLWAPGGLANRLAIDVANKTNTLLILWN